MIDLQHICSAADGCAEHLPLHIVTTKSITNVRRTLHTAGFPEFAEMDIHTVAEMKCVHEQIRRRCVHTGDCRIIILTNIDRLSEKRRARLVRILDLSWNTSRFILIVDRAGPSTLGPRLWSRALIVRSDSTARSSSSLGKSILRMYDRIVAAGRSGTRLDMKMRHIVKKTAELAVQERSVNRIFEELGRAAVVRGYVPGLSVATYYAHQAAQSPGREFVALQSCIIELVARYEQRTHSEK